MKDIKELAFDFAAIEPVLERKIQAMVEFEADTNRVGRQLVQVATDLVGAKTNSIRVPKQTWPTASGTMAFGADYSYATPDYSSYVEITATKKGYGVFIPDEWAMLAVPDIINTEIRKLGRALAEAEDIDIFKTLLGKVSVSEENVGTASSTAETFSLDHSKVLTVSEVLNGTVPITTYTVDYFDGKIHCTSIASGDVIKVSYDYSTRTNVYDAGSASTLLLTDFTKLSSKIKGKRYTADWGVMHPDTEAKAINSLADKYISSTLYKPTLSGEIGTLAGIPFVVTTQMPTGVIMIGVKVAAKLEIQEEVKTEKVRSEDADVLKIRGHVINGIGVTWEDGLALMTNVQDDAAQL